MEVSVHGHQQYLEVSQLGHEKVAEDQNSQEHTGYQLTRRHDVASNLERLAHPLPTVEGNVHTNCQGTVVVADIIIVVVTVILIVIVQ